MFFFHIITKLNSFDRFPFPTYTFHSARPSWNYLDRTPEVWLRRRFIATGRLFTPLVSVLIYIYIVILAEKMVSAERDQRNVRQILWSIFKYFGIILLFKFFPIVSSLNTYSLDVPSECSVELSPNGYQFFTELFQISDKVSDLSCIANWIGDLSPWLLLAVWSLSHGLSDSQCQFLHTHNA